MFIIAITSILTATFAGALINRYRKFKVKNEIENIISLEIPDPYNLKNHKISYGLMMGNPIFHIRFGTKKIVLDKNEYNGFEFQPILFTILSSNFSFYKKNESDKTLLGLGFGLGL